MNRTVIWKEIRENLFAMKGMLWLFVIALLFSGMSYSFVTVKELSLLAQTEVLVTMGKMILGVALLVSIILSFVSFSSEKEQGTIESLLLTPVSNMQLAMGKLMGTMTMWGLVYLGVLAGASWNGIAGFMNTFSTVVLLVMMAGAAALVYLFVKKRFDRKTRA